LPTSVTSSVGIVACRLKATELVSYNRSSIYLFIYETHIELTHRYDCYVQDVANDWLYASGRPRWVVEEDIPSSNWGHYMNFLCMNPGVVFRPIADVVRSIVLTSGTLAPLVTFNSELDTTFGNELQTAHIIDENQVC
jgi:Rad3-related DNA helicase